MTSDQTENYLQMEVKYMMKNTVKRKVIATACAVCAMFSMTTTAMAA